MACKAVGCVRGVMGKQVACRVCQRCHGSKWPVGRVKRCHGTCLSHTNCMVLFRWKIHFTVNKYLSKLSSRYYKGNKITLHKSTSYETITINGKLEDSRAFRNQNLSK